VRSLRRVLRRLAKSLGVVVGELSDAWAIFVAELTGLITFLLGAPLWVVGLSAGAVLGVRVAAGLFLPTERAPREQPLTEDQAAVAHLLVDGLATAGVARVLRRSEAEIRELQRVVYKTVGSREPSRIREWLREKGMRPPRPPIITQLINSDLVRVTVTVGSLYGVWRTMVCPGLLGFWPGLSCP